jgi:hypothetical protein
MKRLLYLLLATFAWDARIQTAAFPRPAESIQVIRAVGPEGRGNEEAAAAWKELAAGDAATIPSLLAAMDGANDLALNWLRAAVEVIASREAAAGHALPLGSLETFVRQTQHHPRARRLAYELIVGARPEATGRLLANMLDDPSTELRRDAVQRVVDEATALRKAGRTNEAVPKLQTALRSARDVDQLESLAKDLKELGHPVLLPKLFGWLTSWKVIGPFDSSNGAGFDKVFPPEERIDLDAEYQGKTGRVRWQNFEAQGDYGRVDLNVPCGALKGVAGYAYTEFSSPKARPVELRLGCKNAWKIWFNGKLLFGRDEYHRGVEIDQYRLATTLQAGTNRLLVKICQNELKEDWTKEWEFQLRITDALGTPIASAKP